VKRAVAATYVLASGLLALHFLADRNAGAAPLRLTAALDATAFLDSVGVNVHFSFDDGPYARRDSVVRLIRELGVRHLRDGMTLGRDDVCRTDRRLANLGIRFTFITQAYPSASALSAWARCVGGALEAFEGINEYDNTHPADDADWIRTSRVSQAELYRLVRDEPSWARIAVVGPSFTSVGAARAVGDLSGVLDEGNTHDYFAGHEPGTPGWGPGGYGSIQFNLATARLNSGAKPIVATETGYGTLPSPQCVDEESQAIYVPRLFLDQLAAGIPRTFEYELLDEGDSLFDTYGLLRRDLSPKPAFRALASTLRELRPRHTGRRSGTMPIVVEHASPDLRSLLFARGLADYVLAVWREVSVWDPNSQRPVPVSSEPVTVLFGVRITGARVVELNAKGELVRGAPLVDPPHRINLMVGPRVTFVELRTSTVP
jgi:hypothetical protein